MGEMMDFKNPDWNNTISSPFEYSLKQFMSTDAGMEQRWGTGGEFVSDEFTPVQDDKHRQQAVPEAGIESQRGEIDVPENLRIPMNLLGYGDIAIERMIRNGGIYKQIETGKSVKSAIGYEYVAGLNNLKLKDEDVIKWLKFLSRNTDAAVQTLPHDMDREEYRNFYMSMYSAAFLELLSFYSSSDDYVPPSKLISHMHSLMKGSAKDDDIKPMTALAKFLDVKEFGKDNKGYSKMYMLRLANPEDNRLHEICPAIYILNENGKARAFVDKNDALKHLKHHKGGRKIVAFKNAFKKGNRVNTAIVIASIASLTIACYFIWKNKKGG